MNHRLLQIRHELKKHNLDAILISSVANIFYLTSYEGFSRDEREAYLFITKNAQYIITDGRYTEAVKKHLRPDSRRVKSTHTRFVLSRHIGSFTIIKRSHQNPLKKIFTELIKKHKIKRLGIEENNLTVSEYEFIKKHLNDIYHLSEIISASRAVKDSDEIKKIEAACALGDKVFTSVLHKIKKGTTEKELAFEIEFFIKKHGADISFRPIVAYGENAAIPHHLTSDQRLKTNSWVLMDFGAKVDNYCSDMTRTVFFGHATTEQKRMHQTVLDAQKKAIECIEKRHAELASASSKRIPKQVRNNKEIRASDVDKVARSYIESQGYPSIPHSLGHGIGTDVHEAPTLSPKSKSVLRNNMVFSVEPGIYLPETGGVRIEDLVVLEKTGCRLLTNAPRAIIEI